MIGFGVAIFLGSFLLFISEMMLGKVLLPWFGGGASVWTDDSSSLLDVVSW